MLITRSGVCLCGGELKQGERKHHWIYHLYERHTVYTKNADRTSGGQPSPPTHTTNPGVKFYSRRASDGEKTKISYSFEQAVGESVS